MRILMLGAGATGGYLGGRLQQAGCDVTFLVRVHRAMRLREEGLSIRSPLGNVRFEPRIVTSATLATLRQPYDLDDAMKAITPAVGETTNIVPLLNGMAHFDALDARFGTEHVLGGCVPSRRH